MRTRPNSRNDERGAAMVEFAFLVPVLLLIVCGIVDFGLAINAQVTVTHASREAVRVQALGGSAAETVDAGVGAATPRAVSVTTGACDEGQPTQVTVETTDFEYLTPVASLMGFFGAAAVVPDNFTGVGVMRCGG